MLATLILIALAMLSPLLLALVLSARYRRFTAPARPGPRRCDRDRRTWDELDEDEREYLRCYFK